MWKVLVQNMYAANFLAQKIHLFLFGENKVLFIYARRKNSKLVRVSKTASVIGLRDG